MAEDLIVPDVGKQSLRVRKGAAAFQMISIEGEEKVPEIVEAASLYPRPNVN